jgi:hypothetical protein
MEIDWFRVTKYKTDGVLCVVLRAAIMVTHRHRKKAEVAEQTKSILPSRKLRNSRPLLGILAVSRGAPFATCPNVNPSPRSR